MVEVFIEALERRQAEQVSQGIAGVEHALTSPARSEPPHQLFDVGAGHEADASQERFIAGLDA